MSFKCDKCGDLDYVLFDGYPFGDRMLEDVMFRRYNDGHVEINSDDAYWQKLNSKMWLETAKEWSDDLDIGTCPKCKEDVDGDPNWTAARGGIPIAVMDAKTWLDELSKKK